MIDPVELGQRIQERRKQQGLTQEQLGNDLFVSPQAVSKWENGESLPDIGTLPALCKTLGTSADALLGIDSELGIETLGGKLAQRISGLRDKEERHAALMTALGFLIPPYRDMRNGIRIFPINCRMRIRDLWDSAFGAVAAWYALSAAKSSKKISHRPI